MNVPIPFSSRPYYRNESAYIRTVGQPHQTYHRTILLTIEDILHFFRRETKFQKQIKDIKWEMDEEKRRQLKKRLPAVVFLSEPQDKREDVACIPNGVLCLDFDGITLGGKLESAKKNIAAVPYVFAVGLSVSARGIFALAAYEVRRT